MRWRFFEQKKTNFSLISEQATYSQLENVIKTYVNAPDKENISTKQKFSML